MQITSIEIRQAYGWEKENGLIGKAVFSTGENGITFTVPLSEQTLAHIVQCIDVDSKAALGIACVEVPKAIEGDLLLTHSETD